MDKKRTFGTKNGTIDHKRGSREIYRVVFYRSASGREPVRAWLRQLDKASRKRVGENLFTLQLGWPLGMPLARKLPASDLKLARKRLAFVAKGRKHEPGK